PWWCPCCPPNLARLITSLSGYLLCEGPDGIAVHQYVSCEASFPGIRLTMKSGLPFAGHNSIEIATEGPRDQTLVLRLPGWAGKTTLNINGQSQSGEAQNGYVYLRRVWNNGDRIELNFEMPVRQKFARFDVEADRGRTALSRGPLVYCIEQADNGPDLDRYVLPAQAEFQPAEANDLLGGVTVLKGRALRETDSSDKLYTEHAPAAEPVELCAIPYYAWANREPGEMQVWMRRSA
ncbi:MAG: glycoside hydrolase family 127 protein, partial [Verrucomicrobia bacterium]|nr:glycoside hydrolase family 127 protein [Verrucomicrobiota bacterium]